MKHIKLFEEYYYPPSFNMEEFKKLNSFNKRILYCRQFLTRISSGSSRIVYKIDDEMVLKLAKNTKGLLQNETEYDLSNNLYVGSIVTKVYDIHPEYYWIESELARKLTKSEFNKIIGLNFDDYCSVMSHHYHNSRPGINFCPRPDPKIVEQMWENEFSYNMLDFMNAYDMPVGDLIRLSSYGIVNRNGIDEIVLIDYGLTDDILNKQYRKKQERY